MEDGDKKVIIPIMVTEADINNEVAGAKANFAELIDLVNERYEAKDSTLKGTEELINGYKQHNEEILRLATERGLHKGLANDELRILQAAAILHDGFKAEKPPEEFASIKKYNLVIHHELAANNVKNDLDKQPKVFGYILGKAEVDVTEEEKGKVVQKIASAIRAHMGPHPGFMSRTLDEVNSELRKLGKPEISHPRPADDDIVAQTLLAVDMASLAGKKGRQKVITIQASDEDFRKGDQIMVDEYNRVDVGLTLGEAALLRAFQSAEEAMKMIKDADDITWIQKLIEESKDVEYDYDGVKVTYQSAVAKQRQSQEKFKENLKGVD